MRAAIDACVTGCTEPSPASAALLAAVDQALAGDSSYPDRAAFIDADRPDAGHDIARAPQTAAPSCCAPPTVPRNLLYPGAPAAA